MKGNKESHFATLPICCVLAFYLLLASFDDDDAKACQSIGALHANMLWPLACLRPFKLNLKFHLNSNEVQACSTSRLQGVWDF